MLIIFTHKICFSVPLTDIQSFDATAIGVGNIAIVTNLPSSKQKYRYKSYYKLQATALKIEIAAYHEGIVKLFVTNKVLL